MTAVTRRSDGRPYPGSAPRSVPWHDVPVVETAEMFHLAWSLDCGGAQLIYELEVEGREQEWTKRFASVVPCDLHGEAKAR